MRSALLIGVLVVLPSVITVAPSVASADERMERLEQGEVIISSHRVPGQSVKRIRAVGLIRATPEKVWDLVSHCAHFTRTMLRTLESEELSREGNRIQCRVVLEMPFPIQNLTAVTNVRHRVKPGELWERKWTHASGDFKVNRGGWTLRPYNGGRHTIAIYEVLAVPTVEIPAMIRRMAQRKTIPDLFAHIRKQLEPPAQ